MKTAVAGDEEEPRFTGNTFNGTTTSGTTTTWSTVYITVPSGFARARARSYYHPAPNFSTVPAPEPFPDGPLRWECHRLDRPPLPGPESDA
jgi:hypothetical protein